MTLTEAINYVAQNGGRIEFGVHPRSGHPDIAIYLAGYHRLRDEDRGSDEAASLLALVKRIHDTREA